tara:strand:+ start:5372 stop:6310 length:939 start_codon:yes stop_codon:yes gene_type:complete
MPSKTQAFTGTKGIKRAAEANGAADANAAPAPKLGKREPVLLDDLDVSKVELGKIQDGKSGLDQFLPLSYDGGRLHIALAKLPNYCRAPFKAAPGKDKNGNDLPGDPAWGMAFDLTESQYKKFHDMEEAIIAQLFLQREQLLPELAASKKDRGGVTEDNVRDAFKSKLKPANDEKGYAANLRVFVQHNPEKPMAKISKMHLKERADGSKYITKPVQGSLADLQNDRLAVVPIISLVRGVYSGQTGVGLKFELTACDVLTNLRETNVPEPNREGVDASDEPTPEDEPVIKAPSAPGSEHGEASDLFPPIDGNY